MKTKRRELLYLLIAVVSAPVLYLSLYPLGGVATQARNMRKASEFIPTVQRALAGDSRFAHVELFPYTARLGSLAVAGTVPPGALADLKRRVEETSPPVAVMWMVSEDEDWRPSATTSPVAR